MRRAMDTIGVTVQDVLCAAVGGAGVQRLP